MQVDGPFSELENRLKELKSFAEQNSLDLGGELNSLEERATNLKKSFFEKMSVPQIVQVARHVQRPTSLDIVQEVFTDFIELHGDRNFSDDPAMVTACAYFNGEPVFIIAQQKGKDTSMNLYRNFGMSHPEGYRKALRIMKLAEKFNRPLFIFVDTPGAYPGLEAEERGQGEAIARNLREMCSLRVPIIAIVVGEGGSGGALGVSIADRILMMEYAIFSVISPEGCASILFRSAEHANKAAENLKLTSTDLLKLKVIDEVISEPPGGAHNDRNVVYNRIKLSFKKQLATLKELTIDEMLENRYNKFRNIGVFVE